MGVLVNLGGEVHVALNDHPLTLPLKKFLTRSKIH
jgi:hypothetical protein